jgi:2-hydroxy-4-(methylsulfanyl)butanoate S-methyltransferase
VSTDPKHSDVKPATIFRHAFGVYPSIAMLAGMQLDLFTPLGDGPMTETALAQALGVQAQKLRPLLYALVRAELLTVDGDRFANTAEADHYLVCGRPGYMGSAHELYADLWGAALKAGASIRAGAPQVKHDFAATSSDELASFFRGLHAELFGFGAFRRLADVGGGSGGLAIAACQSCAGLEAAVVDLPTVAPIAQSFVDEAGLGSRVKIIANDIVEGAPAARFDVAVVRNLIQVLGPDQARRALRHVGDMLEPGGLLLVVGHVLQDSRLAPWEAVGMNLAFVSIYDEGQAYTEGEHRHWLAEAGLAALDVRYGAARGGSSIVVARKLA